jgi:hypothetical protein
LRFSFFLSRESFRHPVKGGVGNRVDPVPRDAAVRRPDLRARLLEHPYHVRAERTPQPSWKREPQQEPVHHQQVRVSNARGKRFDRASITGLNRNHGIVARWEVNGSDVT